jgi:RNA polymerase-binding protein DksA
VEAVKKSTPKSLVPPKLIEIARTSKPKTTARKKPRELERYRARDARHFRRLIMERREKILKELGLLTESTRNTVSEYSGDHSTYSLHMADQGTDAQEREKAFLLASREGRYLKYLDRAVAMLDEGSYGKCTECGQAIQKQRLELVPTARLCISCKHKEEQRRPR